MTANKVPGVRAALAWNVEIGSSGREHNDAQVVATGARMHTVEEAAAIVTVFVDTPSSHGPRHSRRIELITRYEESGRPDIDPLVRRSGSVGRGLRRTPGSRLAFLGGHACGERR
jgi:ribose 5-phosphate isomerase B